jgi:hypothetical protein
MKHQEIAGLMGSLAPVIGKFVSDAIAPLRAENTRLTESLASVEQRFADISSLREQDKIVFINLVKEEVAKIEIPTKEIDPVEIERVVTEKVEKAVSALPVPENGKDAEPVDLDEVASRAAKLLPIPENGKDADIEVVRAIVVEEVAKVAPEDGKDADPEIIRSMVIEEVSKIDPPKDGKDASPEAIKEEVISALAAILPGELSSAIDKIEKPKDGKGVDPAEVAALIAAEVSKAVDAIENPADGKSVTVDDVRPLLEEMVAAIPKPENGKDADPVDPAVVANLLVDLMPVPKDGKDGVDGKSVTMDEIATLVDGAVALEFAKLVIPEGQQGPQGEAGTSVDIQDLIPIIVAEVETAVAGIAPPKDGEPGAPGADGKSVTIDDVRPLIEEVVSAIEPAKDGKDADPVEIAALIVEDVAKLIPVPADGKGVTVDEVMPAIQEMIEQKFAEIAKPKDGVDGADVVDLLIDHAGMLVATLSNGKTKKLGPIVGKDAEIEPLERMIEEKLESIQAPELDKTTVAKFVEQELERISKDFRKSDDFVPDDVASNVALIVKMMAETPQTQVQKEMQPINVYSDVRLPEMKFPETVVNVSVPEQQAPVVNMAAPIVNVEPAKVEMPKRGKEVTTVTGWDKSGRIKTFEKREVDEE